MSRVPLWLVVFAIVLAAPRAIAGNEADALFAEGRDLMEKGRFAEACPKLQRSEELSPAVGTLINLGFCWEQLARMRSAMEAYAEAEVLARAAKDDKRAGIAHERFVGVEAKVMKLVLRVADEQIPGLAVTRNGTPVPKTDWGKPIPVDPDDIVVVASAPGRISWRGVVQGKGDGAAITVIVPQLEEIKEAPAPKEIFSQRRFIALGLAGGALVTLGAGTALGLGAKSRHDDAAPHCDPSGCDETGAAIQSGAAAQGNVATVLFLVGLALGGASAYLWLTGAPESRKTARIDVGPTGIGGTF
jgi:hypothetical protein